MSVGLMSCVRENSPPLDVDVNVSGPLSLPEPIINNSDLMGSIHSSSHHNIMSSTPLAAQPSSHAENLGGVEAVAPTGTPPTAEQSKRRRFHPLRNLRRIFRRRTVTSATTTAGDTITTALPDNSTTSNSEKNLRSATLSSITSVASASSPSSPITHQQLQDAYLTQSLPKSKSGYTSILGGGKKHQNHDYRVNSEAKTKPKHKHKNQKHHYQSKEHDFDRQKQQEIDDMFDTTRASYHHHHAHMPTTAANTAISSGTSSATKPSLLSQRQSMGVAVLPESINRTFFTDRQKLRSIGDSSQDLDSGSGNDSGTGGGNNSLAKQHGKNGCGSTSGGEMSDSQRSLSEGRLVDSDYSRDGLSQSHDSVFSESATASSLSIVLKAELADVLRKRRNRPDASDEDLGLPRSPASPQRRATGTVHNASASDSHSTSNRSNIGEKHNEVSSLNLLSVNGNEGEEFLASPTTTNILSVRTDLVQERSTMSRYSRLSTLSLSSDILRPHDSSFDGTKDEVDLFSSDWQRLSHTAAKHKMAIRPAKKKGGPSRYHRRTLDTSIPEANEDSNKFAYKQIISDVKDLEMKAKTLSLPPSANVVRVLDEPYTASKESTTKTTKITNSNTPISTNSSTTSTTTATTATTATTTTTNMYGLRNFTAKGSSIFDSKDSVQNKEIEKRCENAKTIQVTAKDSHLLESNETGFLHRLIHSSFKRSIAKTNADEEDQDEIDKKLNEPKKLQMSSASTFTKPSVNEKLRNELLSLENTVEDKRREIRKETYHEAKTMGQTLIANNYAILSKDERKTEDKSQCKPKSGPAARQRYVPKNIGSEESEKKTDDRAATKDTILSKPNISECFQSTTLVREVTMQQSNKNISPVKVEHHFEKKPKFVGLSAFQQKVSRSSDSFARSSNASVLSLDKSLDDLNSASRLKIYEQKQRKSVEKSRSFRAYGEAKENLACKTVHNNMPSLPDLSLNLRVPYYKEFVLHGREYNSSSPTNPIDENHTSFDFEIKNKDLLQSERESHKSFGNYDKNIKHIANHGSGAIIKSPTKSLTPTDVASCFVAENNIDKIAKSSFVNVTRKSISSKNDEQGDDVINASAFSAFLEERIRPTVLSLRKEKSLSDENILNSNGTDYVTLRDKPAIKENTYLSGSIEAPTMETERKSVPALNKKTTNGFRCNSTRRSASVVESKQNSPRSTVPEFMKIQLNRVDPVRTSKGHVVLAKNLKETPKPFSREGSPGKNYSSSSMDDLCFRRLSNESVDINDRISPSAEKRFSGVFPEGFNKQAKVCTGLPPKSPVKKTHISPTTPPTPTINERESPRDLFKFTESYENNNNSVTSSNTNSLSLQERKRLFLNEERSKMEKKLEEIRFERKKSVSEEVTRKSFSKNESEQKETNNNNNYKDMSPVDNCVILRKKSFASSVHSLNGNSVNSNSSSASSGSHKDDPTPELMKVFARRSLKIKDEDLDKMLCSSTISTLAAAQPLKKVNSGSSNPNMDSDKENQSASDEKLDKLPKLETNQNIALIKSNNSQMQSCSQGNGTTININNNNRNSLADFRLGGSKISHTALSTNNNNNGCSVGESITLSTTTGKSYLPPIKISGGLRAMCTERNNNHNNTLSPTRAPTTLERSTIKLGDLSSCSSTEGPINMSKTMERSATMGEFKGIHQRRAEWEQRAKEALK